MSQNTAAKKLFDLLSVRNFEGLQALDSATNKPGVNDQGQPDVNEADMFTFDWTAESGKDYGTVVILLNNDSGLDVFFGDNMGKTMESEDKQDWFEFLNQLKQFSTKNFMSFNPQNLNKLRYSLAGQAAIKEGLFESWNGNSTTSWNGEPTQARLMVRHKKRIGEGDARYRYIESMFVETAEGERYRLPFTRLSAGRAMVEHVRQGGKPYDLRGQHIVSMVEELNVLGRFRRANLGKIFEGDTQGLVTEANAYYENLNRMMSSLSKSRGYETYFENWNPEEITQQDMVIEDIKTLFVEQNLDTRIEAALPLLARIQQGNAMKEANIFEAWVNNVMEGTWSTPDTPEKQKTLTSLLSDELPVGADATNATELLYNLIGDDTLFDQLHDLADDDANADARQLVMDRLMQLQSDPDVAKVLVGLGVDLSQPEVGDMDAEAVKDLEEAEQNTSELDAEFGHGPYDSEIQGTRTATEHPDGQTDFEQTIQSTDTNAKGMTRSNFTQQKGNDVSFMRHYHGVMEGSIRDGVWSADPPPAGGKNVPPPSPNEGPTSKTPAPAPKAPAKKADADMGDDMAVVEETTMSRLSELAGMVNEKGTIGPDAGPMQQTITPGGLEVWSSKPAGTTATPPAAGTSVPSNIKPPAVPAPDNNFPNTKPFGAPPLGADGKPMQQVPIDEEYAAYDDTLAQILKHAGVNNQTTPAPDYETGVVENKWDAITTDKNMEHAPHDVLKRFPHEVKKFKATGELDDDLYHALYDWYLDQGMMPYGIAKARDGDPEEWVHRQLGYEMGLEESDQQLDEIFPAIGAVAGGLARGAATVGSAVVDAIGSAVDAVGSAVARGGLSAATRGASIAHMADKSMDPDTDYQPEMTPASVSVSGPVSDVIVDESACNMTAEGEFCPEHGLEECGMYEGDYGLTLAPTAESRDFDMARLRKLAFGK